MLEKVRRVACLFLVLAVACTAHNPRSCQDGTCTDPSLPFCDVDGSIGGAPSTCLAVSCSSGRIGGCRADQALVCNGAGNNYYTMDCDHGCDPVFGCLECTVDDECPTDKPICDASSKCRVCERDDECTSLVCEAGACVGEANIVYATSNGADDPACSRSAPCTVARALGKAGFATPPLTVRLLPGDYSSGVSVGGATLSPLTIVATGASLEGQFALSIHDSANVDFRGGVLTGAMYSVECDSSPGTSNLHLTGSTLSGTSSTVALADVGACKATFETSALDATASPQIGAVSLRSDGSFLGNRLHVRGNPVQAAAIGGFFVKRASLKIANSLLEDVNIDVYSSDQSGTNSQLFLSNNTILRGAGIICRTGSGATFLTTIVENNIVSWPGQQNSIQTAPECTLRNNLAFPQSMPLPGNVLADPQFVDTTSDYHLRNGSPAIDAAAASAQFPTSSLDLDGVPRPQGAAPDIGCYERAP